MQTFYGIGALAFVLMVFIAVATVVGKMFEFCLFAWFGADAHWLIDVLCGSILLFGMDGLLLILCIFTLFLSIFINTPFIG
jgi:hypothetical protein